MKKFLRFAGLCSAILAVVTFILMMATPAILYDGKDVVAEGTTAIFGKTTTYGGGIISFSSKIDLAWTALLAWIFVLLAMLILICGVILPLLKVKALEKFAGLLNVCAVILLVVAGIFMFVTAPAFFTANGFDNVPNKCALGPGWVIGGIIAIVAGVIAILPAVADFLGKGKKK